MPEDVKEAGCRPLHRPAGKALRVLLLRTVFFSVLCSFASAALRFRSFRASPSCVPPLFPVAKAASGSRRSLRDGRGACLRPRPQVRDDGCLRRTDKAGECGPPYGRAVFASPVFGRFLPPVCAPSVSSGHSSGLSFLKTRSLSRIFCSRLRWKSAMSSI